MVTIKVKMSDGNEFKNGVKVIDKNLDTSATVEEMRQLFNQALGGLGYIIDYKDEENN